MTIKGTYPVINWPSSICELNNLPLDQREAIYRTLIPDWLYTRYGVDPLTLAANGHKVVQFQFAAGSRAAEITVKRRAEDLDPMLYLNIADTFNNQIIVLMLIANDPEAPRFNTDVDQHGNFTSFGTSGRNRPAELAAMAAGLAPGQVRRGLRFFRAALPLFAQFVQRLGHDMFLIEPLAYHNAIMFERYGFGYIRGQRDMAQIHADFQPGGALHSKLSPDKPFQQPAAWKTVRGRSWAIHDGILGHPFTGFQMYRLIDRSLNVNTFPDAVW